MKTEKGFYQTFFALVLPIAMQNLLTALVSASDAFMLGALDQSSLSAVSLAAQIQFVQSLFLAALTIGATVLAAQYWGKGDIKSVERVLAIALKASFLISLVFFFAAGLIPDILMKIFTKDAKLIRLGSSYLRTVSWSYLLMGISQVYLCIMKNSGRTFRSTVYGSAAVLVNIAGNAVLIFGLFGCPAMGITGAALATVAARSLELLLVGFEHIRRDDTLVRIRWRFLRRSNSELKGDFYHYTAPVLANELVWGCGFTMFSVIMGRMGNDATAANSIANIVKNIIACVCFGIGSGSSIFIGNELGKGNLAKAKEYGGKLCHLALIAGVVSGALVFLCSPLVFRFAGSLTPAAKEYLKGMLVVCSYYMVGKSMNSTIIAGIFCAGGDTRFGFLCDTVTMWLIIVPLGMLAAFVWKLPVLVVYFLLNLDELVKLPAVYCHYKQYRWVRNITKESQ